MAVVINGNGAVTGLTALPDSAMASGSVINTSSTTKTDTASASVAQGAVSSALISLSYAAASSSNKLVIVANINLGSSSNANIFSTLLIGGSASAIEVTLQIVDKEFLVQVRKLLLLILLVSQ